MTTTLLTAAGTWASWEMGYPADVARMLTSDWDATLAEIMGADGPKFRWQGIGYPAVGFLNPDPNTSYDESVADGVTEGMRLLEVEFGPLPEIIHATADLDGLVFADLVVLDVDLIGYSQGGEVVIRIAIELLRRGLRPRKILTFGSPCRPPGTTLVGNNPAGSGISRLYTPKVLRRITCDVVRNKGEMYGCARDDTYLPEFYGLFTKAEVSITFAEAALQWAMPYVAGGLGAVLSGNPFSAIKVVDLARAVNTGAQLIDFASTQAHTSYHLPAAEFGGRTGLQVGAEFLQAS